MIIIRISKDTNMKEIKINKCNNLNLINNLKKNSISEGNHGIKLLFKWEYNKNNIECYGWYDGESGFENKHELPPYGKSNFIDKDSSEELLFGDIFIIKKDLKNKLLDMKISEYCDFYNFAMGGFEDCDISTSEDELSEEEVDEDCVLGEEEEEEEEVYEDEDEEYLDEDKNVY